jgi:hypothetical protein
MKEHEEEFKAKLEWICTETNYLETYRAHYTLAGGITKY